MRPHRTLASLLLAVSIAAGWVAWTNAPAHAADEGTQIAAGWFIQGAEVKAPGQTGPTKWGADQAAAFIQSWFPAQIFGKLTAETPPKGLPQSTVTISDTINGRPYKVVVYYVSDGHNAWIMMPLQAIGPGAIVNRKVWDRAPQRTVDAFAGKVHAIPVDNGGILPPTSTAPPGAAASHSSSSDGSSTGPILMAIAIGIVLVGGVVFLARRRRTRADSDMDSPRPESAPREPMQHH